MEEVPFGRFRHKTILIAAAAALLAVAIATMSAGCATQHREPSQTVSPSNGAP
jgi:hypothetical protein